MITFRPAGREDSGWIYERLRPMDRRELAALGAKGNAVEYSRLFSDDPITVCVDSEPVLMYGATRATLSEAAAVWALGTNGCSSIRRSMVRLGREKVRELLNLYPALENHALAENRGTLRWLGLLGFTIDEPRAYGPLGRMFCHIHIERGRTCAS